MFFTIKMHLEWFLQKKYTEKDFHNKNSLEMIFITEIRWKWFYYKKALEMVLTVKMYWN